MSEHRFRSVPVLRDLVPEEAWAGLARYPLQTYPRGRTLLRQGPGGKHVLALVSGMVKVVRTGRDGKERLLAFRGPGEILGEMAVEHDGERLADVRAMSMCKAFVVFNDDFRSFVQEHQLAYPLAVVAASRLREQTEACDGAVHERLAKALIRLVEVSGGVDSFTLTRPELAQHIGVGRNAVSEALKRLGPGRVSATKSRIKVIDVTALKEVVTASDGA
ncbi:Crp/Fnr family transcriptional regulator [Streptomyces sp. NPDC046876]|uniref:Crp/Fnr family transcriptional regulator n=1 Tax=Streptomyces sp. NPDC046876 TaxID=3155616 RepID=UPI0033CC619D